MALAGEGERDGAGEGLVHGVRGLVVEVGGLVGGAGVASVAAGVRAEGGRLFNVVDTDNVSTNIVPPYGHLDWILSLARGVVSAVLADHLHREPREALCLPTELEPQIKFGIGQATEL